MDAFHGKNDVDVIKEDPPYLPRKQPLQNQQVDLSLYGSGARTSLPEEPLVAGPSPAFKKANGNDEVCILASCYWISGSSNLHLN